MTPEQERKQLQVKCSDIETPTEEDNPECYSLPYTLNITKEDLVEYVVYEIQGWECTWDEENGGCIEPVEDFYDSAELYVDEHIDEFLSTGYMGYNETYGYYDFFIEELLSEDEYDKTFNGDKVLRTETHIIPGSIDIVFESKEETFKQGDAITEYRMHPAFSRSTLINKDGEYVLEFLSGIWVGKFESNPEKNSVCYNTPNGTNCNNSTQNPTILPNKRSLIYQDLSYQFYTSKNISKEGNIYGLDNETINAHMMKNEDWGAALYLSHSQYGIDKNIESNSYSGLTTGCGFGDDNTKCTNGYGTVETYPQSTTGNISGIFDMAGGTWEGVMGIRVDSYEDWKEFGSTAYYYDFNNNSSIKGNALYETAGWYGNLDEFSNSDELWVVRGGDYSTMPSGAFHAAGKDYDYDTFDKSDKITWRSVLRPGISDYIEPEE